MAFIMLFSRIRMLTLCVLVAFPVHHVLAQAPDRMVEDLSRAIQRGNARDISRYFSNNVDLSMPRAEGTFSKSQSEMILRDFFSRNKPSAYTMSHQDTLRDGSIYFIGRLSTEEGSTFRCYFHIKKISDAYFIHHIQFELQ